MNKRVTLDDIAAACNTSPATVSLALRNRAGVSRARRAEILEVAHRMGYVARPREARPSGEPMRNVALVFRTPDWTAERGAPALNHFYSWVLTGIQDGANRHRLNLNLGTVPVNLDNEATTLPAMLSSQPHDGVLLVGAFQEATVVSVIEQAGERVPAVLVDSMAPGVSVDSITSDHEGGMAEATRHLIERGHRAIAFAGLPEGIDRNFDLRRRGYEGVMREHGLEPMDIEVGTEPEPLQATLAARRGTFTALACANDYTGTLLLSAARRAGIDVPGELSLIGFDDTMDGRQSHPTLSTMAVDKPGLGRLAVEMLTWRLAWPDGAAMHMTLGTRLISRESVAKLAVGTIVGV